MGLNLPHQTIYHVFWFYFGSVYGLMFCSPVNHPQTEVWCGVFFHLQMLVVYGSQAFPHYIIIMIPNKMIPNRLYDYQIP